MSRQEGSKGEGIKLEEKKVAGESGTIARRAQKKERKKEKRFTETPSN